MNDRVTVFLCGDVMTGRGIDQVLPFPGDPRLHEPSMDSAMGYVELAEQASGPIRRPVEFSYIWGDALEEFQREAPQGKVDQLGNDRNPQRHTLAGKGRPLQNEP